MRISRFIAIITFIVFVIFFLSKIIMEGMFFDGIVYAAVSRNMADGSGTFWIPKLAAAHYLQFIEHPPLGMFILSLFFKVFGDHLWVEKLFTALTLILTCFMIILLWKKIHSKENYTSINFLPVLTFLLIPLVSWSYSNNMLENIQGVFTIFGVFLYLIIYSKTKQKYFVRLFLLFFISLMITAGILTKGPLAMFILAVPVIHFFIFRKETFINAIIDTVIPLIFLFLIFLLILSNDQANYALTKYFNGQFISSISGRSEVTGHYYILIRLLSETAIIAAMAIIFFFIARKMKLKIQSMELKWFLFFLLVGLSAILPIVISPKQHGYYMIPGFSYLAIAAAIIIFPVLRKWSEVIELKKQILWSRINITAIFFLSGVLIFTVLKYAGTVGRDKEIIAVTKMMGDHIPDGSSVSVCYETSLNWALHAYAQRYYKINLYNNLNQEYFLLTEDCIKNITNMSKMELIDSSGIFKLYRK
jgi:4-amino-4-deoxy-L-arabinose transferase-like glycosyltransferase